jgi:hypothetical protein
MFPAAINYVLLSPFMAFLQPINEISTKSWIPYKHIGISISPWIEIYIILKAYKGIFALTLYSLASPFVN